MPEPRPLRCTPLPSGKKYVLGPKKDTSQAEALVSQHVGRGRTPCTSEATRGAGALTLVFPIW